MNPQLQSLTEDRARLISLVLLVAGLVLLVGAFVGATQAEFLVSDLAYIATGGLGGIACLTVAAAVQVAGRSLRRCADLDRIATALSDR